MRETLGVEPGAVTPFGAINDTAGRVTVVLDAALMEHATINSHPLVNTMTTSIARDDLVRFLQRPATRPGSCAVAGPRRRTRVRPDCICGSPDHLIGGIDNAGRGAIRAGPQDQARTHMLRCSAT